MEELQCAKGRQSTQVQEEHLGQKSFLTTTEPQTADLDAAKTE